MLHNVPTMPKSANNFDLYAKKQAACFTKKIIYHI